MAREESDREDRMREAVALNRRMEIVPKAMAPPADDADAATRLPAITAEPIVLGFRSSTGWFSIYFGQDPVYTWDAAGRLRRAYVDGFLFRTQGTTLARLERVRGSSSVELARHDLEVAECANFVARMHRHLRGLHEILSSKSYATTGWVTAPARQPAAKRASNPGVIDATTSSTSDQTDSESQLASDVLAAIERILEQPEPFAPPMPGKR